MNASVEENNRYMFSACRSAYLLQQMSLGMKVGSIDDLEFDTSTRKVQLKPGREPRRYSWLWSTESGIELYFVPVDYLPRD